MSSLVSSTTIYNFTWWLKNCSNWQLRVFEHLHLVRANITYQMRSGINIKLRPHTNDPDVLREIYSQRPYTEGISLAAKPIILDIGAHIGIFATLVAKDYPGARIFCYEPTTNNFSYLEHNCSQNTGDFTLSRKAICVNSGRRTIYVDTINPGNSSFFIKRKPFSRQKVTCTTLEEVVKENKLTKIDLMKLDCEGSEYEVLLNLSPRILEIINNISAEVHTFDSHHPKKISNFLRKRGFKVSIFESGLSDIYYLRAVK